MNLGWLRSARALAIVAGGFTVAGLLALGGWLWYSAGQTRGLAAYAGAMTRAHEAHASGTPAQTRTQAITELEAVLAEYPTSPAAVEAAYELGNLYYAVANYPKARGAFEIALAKDPAPTLHRLARAGVAYTWEAERNHPQAIAAYQALLQGVGPRDFLFEELLLGLARNQELAGQVDAAVATYRRLLKDLPRPRRGDLARARLASLGASEAAE